MVDCSCSVWIGINDIENEGDFRFADGDIVMWTNWATPGYPQDTDHTKNCVMRRPNKNWKDLRCTDLEPFYCGSGL